MTMESVCVVGNITRRGQQRRMVIAAAGALAFLAGLWLTSPGWARLWLFVPALMAILGFAQAQQKT